MSYGSFTLPKFQPSDEVLLSYYLQMGKDPQITAIMPEIDVRKHEPRDLPGAQVVTLNQIELLTGSNYKTWRKQLNGYFSTSHLDDCINSGVPEHIEMEDREAYLATAKYETNWFRNNNTCKNIIRATILDTISGTDDVVVRWKPSIH